jgi:hypothetical protein
MANTGEDTRRAEYQRVLNTEIINKDTAVMQWMLENPEGRWFLLRMFQSCQLTGTTFTGNSSTFFKEGRRSVVCELFELVRSRLGMKGLKLLHQAEMEMMEFEERCEEAAKEKEDEDGY